MIEINLVPDVKQEYIRAKRVRSFVISTAVIVGLSSVAVVVLLAVYAFLGQAVRKNFADAAIKDNNSKLMKVSDLEKTLTIQNQLTKLSELHDGENITSRFFDMLAIINPSAPNQVSFSDARVSSDEQIVRLEGQAVNGYSAADVLKKTILATMFSYRNSDGKTTSVPLAQNVSMSELSYGEDSNGKKVLRFTLTFEYNEAFLARASKDAVIIGPERQNATDSYLQLPLSLFSDRVTTDKKGDT